ncbi:MAG: bifunctional riboflavin kinase/FMN adenylyltransferase [Pirellulaceae bacterium]
MPSATLIRSLSWDDLPSSVRGGAVTVGNFDGVHRGHAVLIQRLVAQARRLDGPAVVFTFDPHPAQLLYPESVPPPLTGIQRKAELLGALGVDAVIACPAERSVLSLSPDEFFERILRTRLAMRVVVEGPNFFFGRNRSGSIDYLRQLCDRAGVLLEVVEPVVADGVYISSSRIRELIQAGNIAAADALLTQPYRVQGLVVRGAGRGAQIGFATANIEPVGMVLPPKGVYAGRAWLRDPAGPSADRRAFSQELNALSATSDALKAYVAAIHLGPNPTFGEDQLKFEVHLVGFHQPLYGETLAVDFYDRLRDIRPFANVGELQQQLSRDVAAACRIAEQR